MAAAENCLPIIANPSFIPLNSCGASFNSLLVSFNAVLNPRVALDSLLIESTYLLLPSISLFCKAFSAITCSLLFLLSATFCATAFLSRISISLYPLDKVFIKLSNSVLLLLNNFICCSKVRFVFSNLDISSLSVKLNFFLPINATILLCMDFSSFSALSTSKSNFTYIRSIFFLSRSILSILD